MERATTVQEMLKGLWRRRLLVLITFAAALAVGSGIVIGLPTTYRATTVVRVEPHRPAPELVTASVTAPVEERLKTVAQELFARPVVEKAIEKLNLEPDLRKRKGTEAAVEAVRGQLDVKVEGDAAFVLSVTDSDPRLAARIANLLPQLFAEQALQVRAAQARNTAAIFDGEIARLAKEVQARETQIAAFKLEHLGELPEQAEPNMRNLDRIMVLLTSRTDSQRELQRHQVELASSRYDAETELGRLKRRELDLNHALLDARSQWTEDHPEVQRLNRELATITGKRAGVESQTQADDANRASVRHQLAALQKGIDDLEKEARFYRSRLDRMPEWGQRLADMNRDYDILRTKYQSLVSRKVEAEVARELEAKGRATMFHVLSAAEPPVAPFKPDRSAAFVLVVLGSLASAVLVGAFREMQDDSLRRAEQARDLSVPVLALVPKIQGGGKAIG